MVLRITESEDKDQMIKMLKRNNYEVFSELIFIPNNVKSTHWKLTIFNRDDLGYVELDQINPNPVLLNHKEEVEYEYC